VQQPRHGGAAAPAGERELSSATGDDASSFLNVGSFRFWFSGDRWEWSDEVARMHGYQPGAVVPTTKLMLSHKHPDDLEYVRDLLDHARRSGQSFSSRHRFIDTSGGVHDAIVVADRIVDDSGAVLGTGGYYIDLTGTSDGGRLETRQEILDEELPDLFHNRAAIEQAKGAMMAVYRISADQAFRVLQWRSQQTNVKLRVLAKMLVDQLSTLPPVPTALQGQFDHLLLTVHERDAEARGR
jgi:ANTAR domain/PAS fold